MSKKFFISIFMLVITICIVGCTDDEEPDKPIVDPNPNVENYEDGKLFYDGLAAVGNKYINKDYQIVLDDKYDDCDPFYKEKAIVTKDTHLKYIINTEGEYLKGPYPMLILCKELELYLYRDFEKFGVMNLKCEELLDVNLEDIPYFSYAHANINLEGVLCVKYNGLYGAIDNKGNWVIEPKYLEPFRFVDGLADVSTSNKSLVIDKKGNIIVEMDKESNSDCLISITENIFLMYNNDLRTFVNKNKESIVSNDSIYKPQKVYSDNFIHSTVKDSYPYHTFIDKFGKQVVDKIFDSVQEMNGFIRCMLNHDTYLYDYDGHLVIDKNYHSIVVNSDYQYIECTNYNNFNDYKVIEQVFYDYDGNLIYSNSDLNPFISKSIVKCRLTSNYYLSCTYYDNGYIQYLEKLENGVAKKISVDKTNIIFGNLFLYNIYTSNKWIFKDVDNNIILELDASSNVDFYTDGYIMFNNRLLVDVNGKLVYN